MDCSAARREIAVMSHDLKGIIYRIEEFHNIKGTAFRIMNEKHLLANEINNMMTKHRARINELQNLTGCPTDYMKIYNTGISVCEFQ
jgi:hypothetical protein